jgi:hypothetical protein
MFFYFQRESIAHQLVMKKKWVEWIVFNAEWRKWEKKRIRFINI